MSGSIQQKCRRERGRNRLGVQLNPIRVIKCFKLILRSLLGIFTLLIEKLGVKGVQVEEIYDLEPNNLPYE